eukprot:352120-Chlamydomonas_euryale.AAC.2
MSEERRVGGVTGISSVRSDWLGCAWRKRAGRAGRRAERPGIAGVRWATWCGGWEAGRWTGGSVVTEAPTCGRSQRFHLLQLKGYNEAASN